MADPAGSRNSESGSELRRAGLDGGVRRFRPRLSADVPEAVRDRGPAPKNSQRRGLGFWAWVMLVAVLVGGAIAGWGLSTGQLQAWLLAETTTVEEVSDPNASPTVNAEDLLGHLPYDEAPEDELVAISADGRFRLREAAAASFTRMLDAARRDGISLAMLSAFRSIAQQQQIFFEIKASRRQTPGERAEVSAPPGYSEHHTGYAIDLGDAGVPSTNLNESFETTRAFEWLDRNAVRFNFELSFPRDNAQGIAYEPWHWRFVGDRNSLETFYKARDKARSQVRPRPTSLLEDKETEETEETTDATNESEEE